MNVIEWNGSKWAGDEPDPLSVLLDRLENNTLEPSQFDGWNTFELAHRSVHAGYDDNGQSIYADAGPMYPEAPYAVIFGGNFYDYSHGFRIVTDDAEVIEVLNAAIEKNLASDRYQKALAEHRDRLEFGRKRREAQMAGRYAA